MVVYYLAYFNTHLSFFLYPCFWLKVPFHAFINLSNSRGFDSGSFLEIFKVVEFGQFKSQAGLPTKKKKPSALNWNGTCKGLLPKLRAQERSAKRRWIHSSKTKRLVMYSLNFLGCRKRRNHWEFLLPGMGISYKGIRGY